MALVPPFAAVGLLVCRACCSVAFRDCSLGSCQAHQKGWGRNRDAERAFPAFAVARSSFGDCERKEVGTEWSQLGVTAQGRPGWILHRLKRWSADRIPRLRGNLWPDFSTLQAAAAAAALECTSSLGLNSMRGSREPVTDRTAAADSLPSAFSSAEGSGPTGLELQSGMLPRDTRSLLRETARSSRQKHLADGLRRAQSAFVEAAPSASLHNEQSEPEQHGQQHYGCPPHGAKAICGRRPRMEDAYTTVPFLLEIPVPSDLFAFDEILPPRIASQVKSSSPSSSDNADSDDSGRGASPAGGPAPRPAAAPKTSPGPAAPPKEGSATNLITAGSASAGGVPHFMETLHFFGVFDGHGGAEAALHCAQTLHQRIAEALSAFTQPSNTPTPTSSLDLKTSDPAPPTHATPSAGSSNGQRAPEAGNLAAGLQDSVAPPHAESAPAGAAATGMPGASSLAHAASGAPTGRLAEAKKGSGEAVSSSDDGDNSLYDKVEQEEAEAREQEAAGGYQMSCSAERFESALTDAFCRTDEEFGKADNAALVGTTAVVTLVGSRSLYVANCGDSRAVLCRNGVAIPLSDDHKAAREDETARVEAAGGQILFWNGVRVMGVLAVSRAIGDHCLRPYVIADPEVTILGRRPDDELLLLASDGLWDVLSNQEACSLAKRCLRRARQRGATRQSAARIAATVLTKAAVDRGSRDNVTVVVVDLSTGVDDTEQLVRTPSVDDGVLSQGENPLPRKLSTRHSTIPEGLPNAEQLAALKAQQASAKWAAAAANP